MAETCSRCGAPASWKLKVTNALMCDEHFNAPGLCQGCGGEFGSDSALHKIGVRKACSSCQPVFEAALRNIDKLIDSKIRNPFGFG